MDIKVKTLLNQVKNSLPIGLTRAHSVSVEGTVTFLTIDTNTAYFILDDDECSIRIYISTNVFQTLKFELSDYQIVKVTGRVSLFRHYIQVAASQINLIEDFVADIDDFVSIEKNNYSKNNSLSFSSSIASILYLGFIFYVLYKLFF